MCVLYNSFVLSQNKWVFGEECDYFKNPANKAEKLKKKN